MEAKKFKIKVPEDPVSVSVSAPNDALNSAFLQAEGEKMGLAHSLQPYYKDTNLRALMS